MTRTAKPRVRLVVCLWMVALLPLGLPLLGQKLPTETRVLLAPPADTLFGMPGFILRVGQLGVIIPPTISAPILFVSDKTQGQKLIGRVGEGPGEFRNVGFVALSGDTLNVWDPSLRRISRFLTSGRALGSKFVELIKSPARCEPVGATGRGGVLCIVGAADTTRFAELVLWEIPVWSPGAPIRLASARVESSRVGVTLRNRKFVTPRFIPIGPFLAPSAGATKWARLENLVSNGSRGKIVLTIGGTGTSSRRWELPFVPWKSAPQLSELSQSRATLLKSRSAYGETSVSELAAAMVKASLPMPALVGGARSVRTGDDGCVWVQLQSRASNRAATKDQWALFSSVKGFQGFVEVPRNARVDDVSCFDAVGILLDEDDSPTVVRWTVGRESNK